MLELRTFRIEGFDVPDYDLYVSRMLEAREMEGRNEEKGEEE